MAKKSLKTSSVVPAGRKVEHFSRIASPDTKLPGKFRAVVGSDQTGAPAWFLFDSIAFWEFVCRIDEKMFEKLSDEEYERVSLGRLIDKLEERWPFSDAYRNEIKREYEEALRDIKAGRVAIHSA